MRASAVQIGDTVTGLDGYEYIFTPVEYIQPLTDEELDTKLVWFTRSSGWGRLVWNALEPDEDVDFVDKVKRIALMTPEAKPDGNG